MFEEVKKSPKLWKLSFGLVMSVFVACQPPAEESSEESTQSSEKPQCNFSAEGTLQKDVAKEAKISCSNINSLYQGKKLKVQYKKDLISIKVYKEDGKVDSEAETGSLILILDKKSDFEKKVQVKGLKLGSGKVTGKVLSARFNADFKVVPASLPSSPSSPSGSPSSPSSPSDSPSGSAPSSPSQPTAAKASATTITVSWSAVSGATSYEVYSDTSSGGLFSSKVATVNSGTTYTDTAPRGATYYYKVKACNAAGCSSLSVISAGVNLSGALSKPNAPSKLTAVKASATATTVSWSAASGATSYEVYRDTSSGGSFSSKVGTVNSGTAYTDTVPGGVTYYYKVKACNVAGCSSLSVVSASVALPPPIPAIKSVFILGADDASAGKIRIDWDSVTGATSYNVYRSTRASFGFFKIGTENTPDKTDTTASPNTTYYYKIDACNAAGCSDQSVAKSIKSPPSPASISLSLFVNGNVFVTWSRVSGASKYHIYTDTTSTVTDSDRKVSTVTSPDTLDDPSPNTTHYYRIQTCNSSGSCSWSNTASVKTGPPPVSISLSILDSGPNAGKVRVTWSGVSGASKYHIYRDTDSRVGGSDHKVSTETTPNVTDTSVSTDKTYYYRVQTCNSGGVCSWSSTESITLLSTAPAKPTNAKHRGNTYSWSAVSGASYYQLMDTRDFSIRRTTSTKIISTNSYAFVRSCNLAGCSDWTFF